MFSIILQKKDYSPSVLVDTTNLTKEEWLEYRRGGIGGSDVAALMGISPFCTSRDIYYDKLNIAPIEKDQSNWVALEMGNLLEDLVARIFEKRTGYQIFKVKKMFYHPEHPFMLANVDYFVSLTDGSTAILEIKTTNYNTKDKWWKNGLECIPDYYECQGRHYMAVTNLNQVFFCCLYSNNEDEVIIRKIERDAAYEEEMIFLEQEFWNNHVLAKVPPPYTEDGDLIIKSLRKYTGKADKAAEPAEMNHHMTAVLMHYIELQKKKGDSEKEMERLKGILVAEMGTKCKATCEKDGVRYTVTYNPVTKTLIDKDNLFRLKMQYPQIYEQFVTISESRRFYVKVSTPVAEKLKKID